VADVSDYGGNGFAGDGFLYRPEQLDGGFGSAKDDGFGIDAKAGQAGSIGDTDVLAVTGELHEEDRRTVRALQAVRAGESEAEGGAGVARGFGEDLVDETLGQIEKPGGLRRNVSLGVEAGRFFDGFDAGSEVVQRPLFRKALHRGLPGVPM
jgi:hypothetical protein